MINSLAFTAFPCGKDEKPAAYWARLQQNKDFLVLQDALSGRKGKMLIELMARHLKPLEPRFVMAQNSEEAAFRDGQLDTFNFLLMAFGTNVGITKPDEQ